MIEEKDFIQSDFNENRWIALRSITTEEKQEIIQALETVKRLRDEKNKYIYFKNTTSNQIPPLTSPYMMFKEIVELLEKIEGKT